MRLLTRPTLAAVFALTASCATAAGNFTLASPDLKPGARLADAQVFNGFGCTGGNISPALEWENAPAGTKSFALLVHDPDAPTGGAGWWHWVVIDLPADARKLAAGAGKAEGTNLPAGAQQIGTDFGSPGWGGPCPPVGDKPHRYHFTLHALKVEKLQLPANATASLAGFMITANSLGKARLTGTYGRSK